MEADTIPGSNSTYGFAGVDAKKPEMLYTCTYCCSCKLCRDPASVHSEYTACPNINTVGKWTQQTIHEAGGIANQLAVKKVSTEAFAKEIKAEQLYAAFASFHEMGGRNYWLLLTKSTAIKAPQAIKVGGAATIRKGQYYVKAQWYRSTSDSQDQKSYMLQDGAVQVPVASIVQEHGLECKAFRNGSIYLTGQEHLAISRHNFSNVAV